MDPLAVAIIGLLVGLGPACGLDRTREELPERTCEVRRSEYGPRPERGF